MHDSAYWTEKMEKCADAEVVEGISEEEMLWIYCKPI